MGPVTLYDHSTGTTEPVLVSLCEYGGDVVAEVTASHGFAPVFAEMLELLFGETHYAVLEEIGDCIPGFGDEAIGRPTPS
jgi:hypothetical protein